MSLLTRPFILSCAFILVAHTNGQDSTWSNAGLADDAAEAPLDIDSLIASFQWETGTIALSEGAITLDVPPTHKFLEAAQAYHLLVDVWENPPGITDALLGVVLHAEADTYSDSPAYVVYYEESGYVHDRDAGRIDYDAKLRDMIREDSLSNVERRAAGYGGLQLIGWASPPHYDRQRKALHWAKEMVSENSERNVLNYNIRVLGRFGVVVINAISTMDHLTEVKAELPSVLDMAAFNKGYRHTDYDPSIDGASQKGLGSLIDGKDEEIKGTIMRLLLIGAGAFVGMLLIIIALWYFFARKR
ncbi:MAG TPA: DUF2167 domain-containing protein [Flavobacteriales bacterium]|nr:DUF2167 domain-containing protein [Flavobacteriales bacterium]